MSKPPSRSDLLRDQFVLGLLGDMIDRYQICEGDLEHIARRAREIVPRYERQASLDDAIKRGIWSLLSEVDGSLDEVQRGGSLDRARQAIHKAAHTTLRGIQDASSGIMELAIRTAEDSVRAELLKAMVHDHAASVGDRSKSRPAASAGPID